MPTLMRRGRFVAWLPAIVLLAGCAARETVTLPVPPGDTGSAISAEIVTPDGPGPFPALVYLHGCSGLGRAARHAADWTRRLVAMGYVVALPDSFSARGYPSGICGSGQRVPPRVRAEDAYAAVRRLEGRPDVRADRIGVVGFSHGGWTVLEATDRERGARARVAAQAQHAFAAAVAFYPECAAGGLSRTHRTAMPLLILGAELDDWTLVAPCRELAERERRAGEPVTIKVYAGAYHAFDAYIPMTRIPEALGGRGATIGGDNASREDSIKEVEAFFGRYLKN